MRDIWSVAVVAIVVVLLVGLVGCASNNLTGEAFKKPYQSKVTKKAPSLSFTKLKCNDTDAGNISIQGRTWGYNISNQTKFVNVTDWCRSSTVLFEYGCYGGFVNQSNVPCNCTSGRC